ncbi:MAG: D-aminoacyl-tRNA deacylase [Gammaproteobacteria bacterium]|nr:D-aminoacyl-tRNA deacylase [Gammaproteobacteria bacterium]
MRALLQRVSSASVSVEDVEIAAVGPGLLVLLGVERGDSVEMATRLANKTASLRVFPSEKKPMDRSVVDTGGSVLVVSQFTLAADVRKGNRPSFSDAAPPDEAEPLVNHYVNTLRQQITAVATGRFGANMQVALVNDGPVTLLLHQA